MQTYNTVEGFTISRLLNDAGVAAVFGSRIHVGTADQGTSNPYVVINITYALGSYSMSGEDDFTEASIQVDGYTSRASERAQGAVALRRALGGASGTVSGVPIQGCFFKGRSDTYDDKDKLYRASLDFDVYYEEYTTTE